MKGWQDVSTHLHFAEGSVFEMAIWAGARRQDQQYTVPSAADPWQTFCDVWYTILQQCHGSNMPLHHVSQQAIAWDPDILHQLLPRHSLDSLVEISQVH